RCIRPDGINGRRRVPDDGCPTWHARITLIECYTANGNHLRRAAAGQYSRIRVRANDRDPHCGQWIEWKLSVGVLQQDCALLLGLLSDGFVVTYVEQSRNGRIVE